MLHADMPPHVPAPSRPKVKMNMDRITYPQLLKKSGLMNQICNLAYPLTGDEKTNEFLQCIQHKASILKLGISLKNSMDNLESLGSNVDERVRKDKQKSRIFGVITAYTQYSESVRKFEVFKSETLASLLPTSGTSDEVAEAESTQLIHDFFTGLKPEGAFESLLEAPLTYDTLSRHLISHQEAQDSLSKKLENTMITVTGDNNWKKSLGEDTAIEEVLNIGANTLLKMDCKGAALKTLLDDVQKEKGLEFGQSNEFILKSYSIGP